MDNPLKAVSIKNPMSSSAIKRQKKYAGVLGYVVSIPWSTIKSVAKLVATQFEPGFNSMKYN